MRLETKQLLIRTLEPWDAQDLYRVCRQPHIVRFMADWSEGMKGPEDYLGYIRWMSRKKDRADSRENKRYAIALRESGQFVGMVGMGREETLNEVEVAYFTAEEYQGKGYASEALSVLTAWCLANFNARKLPYLIATVDEANAASRRVAEKCGYRLFEKRYPVGHTQPNMESDCYYYYRAYRPGDGPEASADATGDG